MKEIRKAQLARIFEYNPEWADYHIICSTRHQYVYVGVPKAASTTVRRVLTWLEVDRNLAEVPNDVWDWSLLPMPPISRLNVKIEEVFFAQNYFRFAFVRNPFTRIVSCYLDKIAGPFHQRRFRLAKLGLKSDALISFQTFLGCVKEMPFSDDHWAPQVRLIRPDRINYDIIGKFETFDSSFTRILERIHLTAAVPWGRLSDTHHATDAMSRVSELIGIDEIKIIEEVYDADFEAFKYSRDPQLAAI